MEHQEQTQEKSKSRSHISARHKEPVAAISVGILLLVLLFVFGVGVFMIRDFVSFTNTQQTAKPKIEPVQKNETKQLDAVVLDSSTSQGDQAFQPMPDMQFVIVDVDVVHRLDAPKWFSPVLETYIKDQTGNKYELSPVMLDNPFDAREYKINEHAMGELSYMVPKIAANLSWCYEVSALNLKSCTDL